MRLGLLAGALLLATLPTAGSALGGFVQDRLASAGAFAQEELAAFGGADADGVYQGARRYAEREGDAGLAMYAFAVAWAEGQAAGTAGPLGAWAVNTTSSLGSAAAGLAQQHANETRHFVNSCGKGWFPALGPGWEFVRGFCLTQRAVAERLLGQPLPQL